ncbi:hypothetical protein VUN82_09395 [Micrococcaceae bacterium Sec5.1]
MALSPGGGRATGTEAAVDGWNLRRIRTLDGWYLNMRGGRLAARNVQLNLGASVQLVAYLNGERIDATQMAHDHWRGLVNHPLYESLVLLECGLRASRVTRKGRQFFKHYPDVECGFEHKSESAQHLAMKRALKDRIDAVPGWRAEVEHAHPERLWIADVMAFHVSGKRLAFEVQLSAQSEDEYIFRSQRYIDDRVGPVWVVPGNVDWIRVKLPTIVTNFGKSNDLPDDPAALMEASAYQPMVHAIARVGSVVDHVLHPSFRWAHGTPTRQQELLAQEDMKRAQDAETAKLSAAAALTAKLLADEETLRRNARHAAEFVSLAVPPDIISTPAIVAGMNIWASVVKCPGNGHSMLIWRLVEPPYAVNSRPYQLDRENYQNVCARVSTWLEKEGHGLPKADIVRFKGLGKRQGFACPECKEIIRERLVAALPRTKWSLIAAGILNRSGRPPVVQEALPSEQGIHRPTPPEEPSRAPIQQTNDEVNPRLLGPKSKPLWMLEARGGRDIAERLAAKEAQTARMQTIRDNPRYRASPNGFRFYCTDCGGIFEDDKEGIHADGGCIIPSKRGSGWW